ncbi:hypothetical protein ACH9L7_09010 [Haloferax sp. S1W]|uniref:hypothetical protein n=1 Tax=Haloferax sp. S1W TaxID=3377110 RepID=UPI0037CBAFDA
MISNTHAVEDGTPLMCRCSPHDITTGPVVLPVALSETFVEEQSVTVFGGFPRYLVTELLSGPCYRR